MEASEDASNIPALVQRLRSGRRTEQLRAAQRIYALAEDKSLWPAIAAAGGIPALVQLMRSSSNAVRSAACCALTDVICTPGGEAAFMAAGGLAPLLDCLLRCSNEQVMAAATYLAGNVLLDSNPRRAECCAALVGSLPILVRRLHDQRPLPGATARLLRNLCSSAVASTDVEKDAAVAAGALPALAQLLQNGNAYEQSNALSMLATLAFNTTNQAAIAAEGLISTFAQQLLNADRNVQRWAAGAVHGLTLGNAGQPSPRYCEAIVAAGAVPCLVRCLEADNERTRLRAAWALHNLCSASAAACCKARSAGAVAALQRLPQSEDVQVKEAADILLGVLQRSPAAAARPSGGACAPPGSQRSLPPSTRQRPPAPRLCAAPGCTATRVLHRCGGCGTVRYCSAACSHAHWREHRTECRRLQAERTGKAEGGGGSEI